MPKRFPTFIRSLLDWYGKSKRDLPWRRESSPYKVWVSEIMLQQTQVGTVLPYYQKFLSRFPDLRALARASETEVLSLWSGLGDYQRARNLLKAAKLLVSQYGGEFPKEEKEMLRLPGIGRYTAGAVLSIAYHRPVPILDGNVKRVLSRIFLKESQDDLWRLTGDLVSQAGSEGHDPSNFNQSLMELGALICLPKEPICLQCPARKSCQAYRKGIQNQVPAPAKREKTVVQSYLLLLISRRRNGSREFLLRRRSGKTGWLKGLWEFPMVLKDDRKIRTGRKLGQFTHTITHHRLNISVLFCDLREFIERYSKICHSEVAVGDRRIYGLSKEVDSSSPINRGLRMTSAYRWFDEKKVRSLPSSSILRKALALI